MTRNSSELKKNKISAVHGTFTIVRELPHAPERVFDEKKISVSLATVELEPARIGKKEGTRMRVTEQGAFLGGYDDAGSREHGTGSLMDALEKSLER